MTTVLATAAAIAALAAAGALPVVAAVGLRWVSVTLAPLAGAVLAALSATASLTFGGPLLSWFVGLAALAAACAFGLWVVRPDLGPRRAAPGDLGGAVHRLMGVVGFLAVVTACAWSLRGLRSPTVGFDARALWVMRPGWFLQSHAHLLVDLKARGLVLTQSAYPPLVSASAAVAWKITGVHTARLGVTTVAVLNGCALASAALALVECGREMAGREARAWVPMVAGIVTAVLLVVVAAGVTEPFLTNGYADPLWSLAAVGAVAFGLQLRDDPSARAATVVLILVAGTTKDEGLVTAIALVVLVAARSIGLAGLRGAWQRWVAPVVVAGCELAVLAWWPVMMRVIDARGASSTFTSDTDVAHRADATVHGMSPYLHVLVLAVPLAVVGGLVLSGVRRRGGVGHDLWAWVALSTGLTAVGAVLVASTSPIGPWILSTVHRITEYPILQGWWIIGVWAVVAAAGLGGSRPDAPAPAPTADVEEHGPGPTPIGAPVGVVG
ncbi:MAG TPA: hypothetical protein VF320_05645 [Acidimicrobiales bacterium]